MYSLVCSLPKLPQANESKEQGAGYAPPSNLHAIKPELVLDPPEPEVYRLAGKKLLVVTVPSTDGPVYQAGGIFWIRQGTRTRALSMAELSEMIYDRGLRDWELEPAYNATMEDIDSGKVQSFIERDSAESLPRCGFSHESLPLQTSLYSVFSRLKLTAKPVDNRRFRWTSLDKKEGN